MRYFFSKNKISCAHYLILVIVISAIYTSLRFSLNVEYKGATWEQIYNFAAPIPFGYRILIPILSRPIVYLGFSVKEAFIFWEFIFSLSLVVSLKHLFSLYFSLRWAKVLSIFSVYMLPFVYLLKFKWPLFYPYDTPSLFFTILGLIFIIKNRVLYIAIITALGTLNRESAILIPMMYVLIYYDRERVKKFVLSAFFLFLVYFSIRYGIKLFTADNPMPYKGSMAFLYGKNFRVNNNLQWLASKDNMLVLFGTFSFLPLLCLYVRKNIPCYLRRIVIAIWIYFYMLLFIGNLYEPRIFGEMVVLLWFLVATGGVSYLTSQPIHSLYSLDASSTHTPFAKLKVIEKYAVYILPIVVAGIIIIVNSLGVSFFY